ncbi:hypothetical protein B0H13DRAFT_2541254 [Mycena leptocephala]|nr:hypothetical protein B0H13DRAFT_2541254 [Mycena leptocephala]
MGHDGKKDKESRKTGIPAISRLVSSRLERIPTDDRFWLPAGVLWYPAQCIECHKDRECKKDEYEFQWLECKDGTTYNSATSDLPVLMQRTFCQEIDGIHLTDKQIGKVRMLHYLDPGFERHENPGLAAIFDAAVHPIVTILAKFHNSHPVIENFKTYFKGKKKNDRSRHADQCMDNYGLVSNPELEAILEPALGQIMNYPDLTHLQDHERVNADLQRFDEPLNLNGDSLGDLLDGQVVYCPNDGDAGIEAMFLFSGGPFDRMLKFRFRCLEITRFPTTDPIPVIIKRKEPQDVEGEPPSKRAKPNPVRMPVKAKRQPKAKPKPTSGTSPSKNVV